MSPSFPSPSRRDPRQTITGQEQMTSTLPLVSAQRPQPSHLYVRAPWTVTEGFAGRRGLKRPGSSDGAGILLQLERMPPAAPRMASPGSCPRRARLARGWHGRPDSTSPLALERRPTETKPEGPPPPAGFPIAWNV